MALSPQQLRETLQKRELEKLIRETVRAEIQHIVEREMKEMKRNDLFKDQEGAERVAKEVAQQEIADFKDKTNDRVERALSKLEETEESTEKTTKELVQSAIEKFQNLLNQTLASFRSEIQSKVNESLQALNKKQDEIANNVSKMRGPKGEKGEKGEKGDKGDKPIAGVDFPKPKDGKEISASAIIAKILSLKEGNRLPIKAINGLEERLQTMTANISSARRAKGGGGGGGMGNPVSFSFDGDGSTTDFTLSDKPAAGGSAIWVHYQGQWLQPTTHYTVSGTTLSLTFTPNDGTKVEGLLIR